MIREMTESDWEDVRAIYEDAIRVGKSTFSTECPTFEEFDSSHRRKCRYVYEESSHVLGWIALSPTSSKPAYSGSAEVSLYVSYDSQGRGIGTMLLQHLIDHALENGFWSLYSVIFSINETSIRLHEKLGFRTIGYRERVARDIFGTWQDCTLMEKRL